MILAKILMAVTVTLDTDEVPEGVFQSIALGSVGERNHYRARPRLGSRLNTPILFVR